MARVAEGRYGSGGADQGTVRRANLALLLRSLRGTGARSRARLATDLGLNKATVSSLVGELMERGLVREGSAERGAVGRPGTIVEINGAGAYGVGAEINVHHVTTLAVDLAGDTVSKQRTSLDTRGMAPSLVVDHLFELLESTLSELAAREVFPVSVVVGVAGLVDRDTGVVTVAPNLDWHDVPLAALLRERLRRPELLVEVANEANLAAVAEAGHGDHERRDVLVVHGEVGIGGGIVADGRLYQGRSGFAGEFGHMVLDRGGRRCGCGQSGCWETLIGLSRLLEDAADEGDVLRSADLGLEQKIAEINRRAEAGDERTLAALHSVGTWVGIGAATLANALNPGVIVLSGYLGDVGAWIKDEVEAELAGGVVAPGGGGTRIALSTIGLSAAVRGAAAVAIEHVYDDPTLVPRTGVDDLGATS